MIELDKKLFLLLNMDMGEFGDQFFIFITSHSTFVYISLIAAFIVFRKFGLYAAFLTIALIGAGIGATDMFSNIFKYNIEKFRPLYTADIQLQANLVMDYLTLGLFGTVSGHASTSVFLAGFTSKIIKNKYYTTFAVIMAILICYSRIYLAMHFPMDITLGAIIGIVASILFYKLYVKLLTIRIKK